MTRTEQNWNSGWRFTLGSREDGPFEAVTLPHDWACRRPVAESAPGGAAQGFFVREGIGWYQKELVLDAVAPKAVYRLCFDGVYENCTIYVNGDAVARQRYGYTAFAADITAQLHAGANRIEVRVDCSDTTADRWYSGAGITRDVTLQILPENFLDAGQIQITTAVQEQGAQGQVCVRLDSPAAVRAVLLDAAGAVAAEAQGTGTALTLTVPAPRLWSAERPNLYRLRLTRLENGKPADELELPVGIRQVELRAGKGLFVNGERIKLKGVCVHQDGGALGNAATRQFWRDRLLKLKGIGCNALRCAHHMPAKWFLDLCDELGFYVYEEPFDKWTGGSYGRYFAGGWQQDLEAMVRRDRNHACVLFWGVGNEVEFQGQASMLEILRRLREALLALDATRPVCYAMNPHFKFESDIDIRTVRDIQKFVDETDEREIATVAGRVERIAKIAQYVDVICCNYQEQWYDAIHEALPDKLILGTEIYQYFRGEGERFQNYAERVPWLDAANRDYVIGGMIWAGIDYLGESMGWPSKGWSGSLMQTNNVLRPLAYYYKSIWTQEPMVYFAVLDQTLPDEFVKEHWGTPPFAAHWEFAQLRKGLVPYMVATNCEEVRFALGGKSYCAPRPSDCPNGLITGYLPYVRGKLTVIGYRDGREVCRQCIETPGDAAQLRFEEAGRTAHEAGQHRLLTVYAADAVGVPVFKADETVRFAVEGPAELAAVDNGDLCCTQPYAGDQVRLYHGRASVIVRYTGEEGTVRVTASAAGLQSAACEL